MSATSKWLNSSGPHGAGTGAQGSTATRNRIGAKNARAMHSGAAVGQARSRPLPLDGITGKTAGRWGTGEDQADLDVIEIEHE